MKGAYFHTPAPRPLVPARGLGGGSNPVIKPRVSNTSKDLRNPAKPGQRPSSKSKIGSGRRDSSTILIKSSRDDHRSPAVPSAFPTLNKVNIVPENLTPTIEAIPLDHSRPPTSNASLPPISSDNVPERRKSRPTTRTSVSVPNTNPNSNPNSNSNNNSMFIIQSITNSNGSSNEPTPQPSLPLTQNNTMNQRLSSKLMAEPVLQGSFPPTKAKITQQQQQQQQQQQPVEKPPLSSSQQQQQQNQQQQKQPIKKQTTDSDINNNKKIQSNSLKSSVNVPPINISLSEDKIHEKCITPQAQPSESNIQILTPVNNNNNNNNTILDDDNIVLPSPVVRGRIPENFKIKPILKASSTNNNNENDDDEDSDSSDFEIQLSFDDPNKIKEREEKRKEKELKKQQLLEQKKKKRVGLKWGDVHIREYKSTICPSSVPQSTGVPVGLSWEITIDDEVTPVESFEKWKEDQKDRIDVHDYQREGILASMERQWIVQRAGVSKEVITRVQKEVEQTRMQRFRSSNDEITDEEEKKLSASFSSHLTDQLRQIQQLMKEQGIT